MTMLPLWGGGENQGSAADLRVGARWRLWWCRVVASRRGPALSGTRAYHASCARPTRWVQRCGAIRAGGRSGHVSGGQRTGGIGLAGCCWRGIGQRSWAAAKRGSVELAAEFTFERRAAGRASACEEGAAPLVSGDASNWQAFHPARGRQGGGQGLGRGRGRVCGMQRNAGTLPCDCRALATTASAAWSHFPPPCIVQHVLERQQRMGDATRRTAGRAAAPPIPTSRYREHPGAPAGSTDSSRATASSGLRLLAQWPGWQVACVGRWPAAGLLGVEALGRGAQAPARGLQGRGAALHMAGEHIFIQCLLSSFTSAQE
jgi:hypothetical protein